MVDVIVVGAGAAGLMAARELLRAGADVMVLEASGRCGGRILTVHDAAAGVPIELGAEFVHGEAPETTRLLDEARLATVPVSGEHFRSDRGDLSPEDAVWKRMRKVFRHLNSDRKRDRSFQEFLDDKPGGRKLRNEREFVRGFVQGFNGADLSVISEKSVAQQGDPTEGAADARRIVDGYGALVEYMLRQVDKNIRRNTFVRRIVPDADQLRVIDETGLEYSARAVIVTVPLPLLQDDTVSIEADAPAFRNALGNIAMGQVVRVTLVMKERFWEKTSDRLSFVHSPERPFNVWWSQYPVQAPIITAWAGGPPAVDLCGADHENTAMRELADVFGTRRKRIESMVESVHVHNWMTDPYIHGAYSYIPVGGTSAPRVLARGVSDTIFLAGEATDSASGGTVEAAIASGKRAAEKALRAIREVVPA